MTEIPADEPIVLGWNDSPVTGDRIDVNENSFIAGDLAGARIEIRSTGLHAFNGTGTETAHIDGAEGVFVGGEFRTSDTLPGQVTLSDTASQGGPGLSVEPEDATGYDVLPSIGPDGPEMHIRGGVSTDGNLAGAAFTPSKVSIYHNGPGTNGTGAWMDVGDMQADLGVRPDITNPMHESGIRAREQSVTAFSQSAAGLGDIYASPTGASISFKDPAEQTSEYTARIVSDASGAKLLFRPPGGNGGRFTVDAEGIWVEREITPQSQQWVRYNLEGTTWTNLTLLNGWQAYTGSGGYFNGLRAQRTPLGIRVDGMIQGGTTGVIAVLPDSMQDVAAKQFTAVASVSGREPAYMAVARSTAHGDKYVVHYLQGPSAPNYVSVSTDAALL